MRIYLTMDEIMSAVFLTERQKTFQLSKSYQLETFLNITVKILNKNFEKNKKKTWIKKLYKNKKQMSLFLYKTLLNQLIKTFAEKLFINIYQQIQLLKKNLHIVNLVFKKDKINSFLKNCSASLKSVQVQCSSTEGILSIKDLFFLNFLSLNKKSWMLLECYFFYNLRFLFFSRTKNFENMFYISETAVFSSYSFCLYNFVLNIANKNFSSNYGEFISFFKHKQIFKNSFVVFFFNFLYTEQRSITNYLIVTDNNFININECLNIIKSKLNKNLYFLTKIETCFNYTVFIKNTKLLTWLFWRFSRSFSSYFFNMNRLLLILVNSKNNYMTKYFKNFFSTCFYLILEIKYSFIHYREKKLESNLLTLESKNEQFFIFYNHLIIFFTTQKKNLKIFLHTANILYNKISLKIKNSEIVHSCFSLVTKNSGFDFKGFYFIQKIFLNLKKKHNSIILNNFINILPLWTIQEKKSENKVITWKTYIFPSIHYLLVYLKKLKKIVNNSKVKAQNILIKKLKNQITQWCHYYQFLFLQEKNLQTLQICDFLLSKWLWRWACRRHSNKSHSWIRNKYYLLNKIGNNLKWKFCVFNKTTSIFECLPKHTKIKPFYCKKVNPASSLYDEKWKYWYFNALLVT